MKNLKNETESRRFKAFFFSNLKKLEKNLKKNLKNITAQFDDGTSC